jgi:LysR family transcriptional regulator, low CO2-responsive transcriptional regulator
MSFTQFRAFHAVASEGGFTRGAARLGISQPAVTVQVKALEQTYGVELFHRRGQKVELTDFGRELWRHSRRLFAQLDDLEALLAAAGSLQIGRLELGADGPFAVMDLLAAFVARYPGVRVTMRLGNASRVLADLREGRTDVAVLNLIQHDRDLYSQSVLEDRLVAFVRDTHPWAGRAGITLSELGDAPLILREAGSATRAALLAALSRAGLSPRVALELGSREAVRQAVLAGLGVGTVFAQELVPDPRLRPLEIDGGGLGATVSLVCLAERRELRAVGAFFEVADDLRARPDQATAF